MVLYLQPGGGRNEVDPRFISLFSVFNVTFPSDKSLRKIYTSILSGHLEPFSKEIRELVNNITTATLDLYRSIIQELPPTPSKFHYIFNLRDLSRVYQGLCLSTPERFDNPAQFVRVWRNECLRVFYDRLISDSDKQRVQVSDPIEFRNREVKTAFLNLNALFFEHSSDISTNGTRKFLIKVDLKE